MNVIQTTSADESSSENSLLSQMRSTVLAWPDGGQATLIGLVFTLWSLAYRGFDGGRWSDIPIFKSFMDPRLYTRDPFINALHDGTPAAFTYAVIGALAHALSFLSLDTVLLLVYLPVSTASLALLYMLARHITGERLAAGLFLILYIADFRLLTVGSTILHSAETTPAFIALPFQLGGLLAVLCRRHLLGGLLLGIGLDVHAPTTILVALGVGGVWLALGFREGFLKPILGGLVLLVAGAPAIIGSIGQHTDALPLWALYLAKAELATDISTTNAFETWHLRLRNLLGFALLATAFLVTPPRRHRLELLAAFVAAVCMCLAAVVFFDLNIRSPFATMVARLQFPRSTWLVNVLGLIVVSGFLVQSWKSRTLPRTLLLTLVASLVLSSPDFIPWEPIWPAATLAAVALAIVHRWIPAMERTLAVLALVICALVGALVVVLSVTGRRLNEIDVSQGVLVVALAVILVILYKATVRFSKSSIQGALTAGTLVVALLSAVGLARIDDILYQRSHAGGLRAAAEFQAWARTSTPIDSVFLTLPSEPNNDTFYKNAERALYLVRERANQAVYFPRHNEEFRARLEALGIDDPVAYKAELDRTYRRLTEAQVRQLARDFGVTHFVPARVGDFSFPIVYQQGGWTVYEVTP